MSRRPCLNALIQDQGFEIWGGVFLGFGAQGGFSVQGSGFRVQDSGFRVQGSGFRVQGSEFTVHGSGFGIRGFEFRNYGV
jgi:hypothetical protein